MTRYRAIERVAFRPNGEPVETIAGEGVLAEPPIGRREIEEQTPQVLVESPLPDDAVSSPIRLRGTANAFEATVWLEVRDAADNVILETFKTATSGRGTRGTCAAELALPKSEGPVTIVALESSARTGARSMSSASPLRSRADTSQRWSGLTTGRLTPCRRSREPSRRLARDRGTGAFSSPPPAQESSS